MIGRFEEILHDLGKLLHLTLHVDKSHSCSLVFMNQITIQLALDMSQENLYLVSKIIEIPPGKFRENVLREALKANDLPDPRTGIFGYYSHSNQLTLYQLYPLSIITAERLVGFMGAFLDLGEMWLKSIQSGQPGPSTATRPLPPGLRP